MAKVTGPLLSMGARGQLGKTLVMSNWKGIATARQYAVPANPRTAGQTAQRSLMTAVVAAFRNFFTVAEGRAAWNRAALVGSMVQSGFNAFVSSAVKIAAGDPDASYARECAVTAGRTCAWAMLNLDDGAVGDEAGNFEIWSGTTKTNLLKIEEVALVMNAVQGVTALGTAGEVRYVKIRKDGQDRSGISELTLIA